MHTNTLLTLPTHLHIPSSVRIPVCGVGNPHTAHVTKCSLAVKRCGWVVWMKTAVYSPTHSHSSTLSAVNGLFWYQSLKSGLQLCLYIYLVLAHCVSQPGHPASQFSSFSASATHRTSTTHQHKLALVVSYTHTHPNDERFNKI